MTRLRQRFLHPNSIPCPIFQPPSLIYSCLRFFMISLFTAGSSNSSNLASTDISYFLKPLMKVGSGCVQDR